MLASHPTLEARRSQPVPAPFAHALESLPQPARGPGPGHAILLRQGQQLVREGERAERYYQVVSGMLRTQRLLPDGRRQVIDFFGPGEVFGLAGGGTHAFDAEAVTDSAVIGHSLRSLGDRLGGDPGLARQMLQALSSALVSAQEQVLLLGRKTARERLASFLLTMADKAGRDDGVELPMKRGDVADHLGLTVETVSRLFAGLKREGLIALSSATDVEFLEVEALAALGSGEAS